MPIVTFNSTPNFDRRLEENSPSGPVLLPRYWWMSFSFIIPFALAAATLLLIALCQHNNHAEALVMRYGCLAGLSGFLLTSYVYWLSVGRRIH